MDVQSINLFIITNLLSATYFSHDTQVSTRRARCCLWNSFNVTIYPLSMHFVAVSLNKAWLLVNEHIRRKKEKIFKYPHWQVTIFYSFIFIHKYEYDTLSKEISSIMSSCVLPVFSFPEEEWEKRFHLDTWKKKKALSQVLRFKPSSSRCHAARRKQTAITGWLDSSRREMRAAEAGNYE